MNSRILIGILAAGGALALALSTLFFSVGKVQEPARLRAFYNPPIDNVESLQNPLQVSEWNSGGLVLSTGRIVTVPGIKNLPLTSAALIEATSHGIEIGPEGRVIGLVRVWHWCGNDPIRKHLARVDVARLLMYLGEGSFAEPSIQPPSWHTTKKRFTDQGWDVGDFSVFVQWNRELEAALRRGGRPSNRPLNLTGAKSAPVG